MNNDTALRSKKSADGKTHYSHLLLFDAPYASTGISLFRTSDTESGLSTKAEFSPAPIRLFVFAQDGEPHGNIRVAPSSSGLSVLPLTSIAPSLPAHFGIRLAQVVAISSSPFTMHAYVESSNGRFANCSRFGSLTPVRYAQPLTLRLSDGTSRERALLIANRGEHDASFRLTLETTVRSYVYEGWIPGLGSAFWSPEMTLGVHASQTSDDMILRIEISEQADSFGVVFIESEWLSTGEYRLKQITPFFSPTMQPEHVIEN